MAGNVAMINIGKQDAAVEYKCRAAVRCVIKKAHQVCIIYVRKGNYYKLPGGGVEPDDENDTVAAQREALEETGCKISVEPNIVTAAIEFCGDLRQTSHAYICTTGSDTGKAALTDLEYSEGLIHQWCSFDEAIQKMSSVEPTSELGPYIKKRDLFLLEKCRGVDSEFPG